MPRAGTAAVKKEVKFTVKDFGTFDGKFQKGQCCGLIEFSGLGIIKNIEDAVKLRRAASGDVGAFDDDELDDVVFEDAVNGEGLLNDGSGGVVLVTSTAEQTRAKSAILLGAGFTKLTTFKNRGSGSQLTLWSAPTLGASRGTLRKEEAYEIVSY